MDLCCAKASSAVTSNSCSHYIPYLFQNTAMIVLLVGCCKGVFTFVALSPSLGAGVANSVPVYLEAAVN